MILFENVTKTYPKTTRPALLDVSLEIPRGEFVFVVGKSGSGKSTMLQLVIKEQDATHGRILVAGRDLEQLPDRKVPALRREIGCVFQDFRLLPNKNVYQNVAYALQVLGTSRSGIRQMVPETLDLVGLAGKEKRLPHQLSGGEQQRVAIARAFINRPAILLADEPTGNLDPATSLEIVQLLDRINRTGTTVVMATHDTQTVNALRKRVIELVAGEVVRDEVGGEYSTGSIPAVRLETGPLAATGGLASSTASGAGMSGGAAYGTGAAGGGAALGRVVKPEGTNAVALLPAVRNPDDSAGGADEEGGDGEDDDGQLPPIGRDADAPRQRRGLFPRARRSRTSDD